MMNFYEETKSVESCVFNDAIFCTLSFLFKIKFYISKDLWSLTVTLPLKVGAVNDKLCEHTKRYACDKYRFEKQRWKSVCHDTYGG